MYFFVTYWVISMDGTYILFIDIIIDNTDNIVFYLLLLHITNYCIILIIIVIIIVFIIIIIITIIIIIIDVCTVPYFVSLVYIWDGLDPSKYEGLYSEHDVHFYSVM